MNFRKGAISQKKDDGTFEDVDVLMGGAEIDDSSKINTKTWSSNKIDSELGALSADLTQLTTTVNGKQNTLTSQDKQDIVKSGITTATLTDAEKVSACGTIGAVRNGKFELIETFSTDSASTWIRTTEPNGTAYNFKNVLVIFETTTTESVTSGVLYVGDNAETPSNSNLLVQNYISSTSTSSRYSLYRTRRETGLIYLERIAWAGLNDNPTYSPQIGAFFKNTSTVYLSRIRSVNFDNGNNIKSIYCTATIPSGVIVYIFAERA